MRLCREPPDNPDLVLDTERESVEESVEKLYRAVISWMGLEARRS